MVPQQQRRRRRRTALPRTTERRLVVVRGSGGFGFTIAGQRPCVVSAVAVGGPAERAGLRAGDALLAVDGASVARAPHAAVARLVAAALGPIALSVAPREAPPTDTEDTEPDERARTRRRHPPPRRRPQLQPVLHHPGCHAAPSTSGVNEILQNLSRAQLTPSLASRLECRAVVGYLGTIETPQGDPSAVAANVRMAVRKLRQERRAATPVLICVLPGALTLRRGAAGVAPPIATYERARILHAGCPSEADTRHFGLVTASAPPAHCTHVFAVDPRTADHSTHQTRAREFNIECTRDPVNDHCLEFPPSAEYVVGVIRGMYSLPDDSSPPLMQISKLTIKGDSPAAGDFFVRVPRDRRAFVANSPQPSNHSEITTTSSNSDSGIGFQNDCRNIADRILVVDFANPQPPINKFRQEAPRRPVGMVGLDTDGLFLSNTTPVVDGFGGQGRPLNLDDVMLNASELRMRHVSPRCEEDTYNYENVYGNVASTSNGVCDSEKVQFECESAVSGGGSMDSMSVYSHEDPRGSMDHLQGREPCGGPMGNQMQQDDSVFLHPANVKCKVRKSKPLNILSKTRNILRGGDRKNESERERRRALSASAGDVAGSGASEECSPLPAAASEPDLRDTQSESSSPFRRWTTGSGAGNSYRHSEHRPLFKMGDRGDEASGWNRWSKGLEQLLTDNAGMAAFASFLRKEYAHENLAFYLICERYNLTTDPEERTTLARVAWDRHLAEGAPEPVNIDAAARRATLAHIDAIPPPPDLFVQDEDDEQPRLLLRCSKIPNTILDENEYIEILDTQTEPSNQQRKGKRYVYDRITREAQAQIYSMIKLDLYPRFMRTRPHPDCARPDLRGVALPYAPGPSTSQERTASGNDTTATPNKTGSYEVRGDVYASSVAPSRQELSDILRGENGELGDDWSTSLPSWVTSACFCCCKNKCDSDSPPSRSESRSALAAPANDGEAAHCCPGCGWLPKREPQEPYEMELRQFSSAPPAAPPLPPPMPPQPEPPQPAPPQPEPPQPEPQRRPVTPHHLPLPMWMDFPVELESPTMSEGDMVSNHAMLCRVVLPDGATSVIGVDDRTVLRVVSKLLDRRGMITPHFTVYCIDGKLEGESPLIDVNAPSSSLGGREVMVELHCAVHLYFRNERTTVSGRPNRPLRQLLAPILMRHFPGVRTRLLLNGRELDPDTQIKDLNGMRVFISEVREDQASVERRHGCSSANVTQYSRDDSKSGSTCKLKQGTSTGELSSTCPSTSSTSQAASLTATKQIEASGRVRAALVSGAPVLHHPDFLENLRETQRAMLSKKDEDNPPNPPPRPPKLTRAPTYV